MADHPPTGAKRLDAESLKALAHPLRVRILATLRALGPATASALGRRLGESSGATSYHLRQLERHGFVEEESGRGSTRERWWRAAHRTTEWVDAPWEDDSAAAAATAFLRRFQADYEQRAVHQWDAEWASWTPRWQDAAASSDVLLRLRVDQLEQLNAEMEGVLQRWIGQEDPEGEHVAVFFRAFPQHEPTL
ncbi:ArsR/SmtB family transcription factor [Pseudonocardia sp. GCM10023141]|uniref:ArsR/SmtB family transcription factor n=1 Tax=Pseudonocardia sp. GCM10023141 TaxID=3252653 RepID=UPI00360BF0E4